jgi:large subunit ribosomal protein L25
MTAEKYVLQAKPRTLTGRKVKQLRAAKILPAHVYGNTAPLNIQMDEKMFNDVFKRAGETSVLSLHVEGEKEARPVLVADYTVDPMSGNMIHIDLRQVNLNVKVKANVPVELEGESEAVKAGGVLIQLVNEIEVEALPNDLPEKFVLNISALNKIGDELKVSNLVFDASKVVLDLGADESLVVVNEPKVEVEPVVAEPVEVETTVQGKKAEEGEEGAEAKPGEKAKAPAAAAKPAEKKEEKK